MIFARICDSLFLPLAITLFVAIPAWLVFRKKFSDKPTGYVLFSLLVLMIVWRIPVGGGSSRYWAMLLFPAMLFAVYVLYASRIGRGFARALVLILAVLFLAKDFRLNWNNRAITNAAAAIAEDAQGRRALVTEFRPTGLLERIGHYAHLPVLSGMYCENAGLQGLYAPARGRYDVLYIVTQSTAKEHENIFPAIQKMGGTLLFSQDKDMRKKKKIYVYKIPIPPAPANLPIQKTFRPEGDFAELVSDGKEGLFPRYWGRYGNPQVVQRADVFDGRNSIFFRGTLECLFSPSIPPHAQDGVLLFSVQATQGTQIRLYCLGLNAERQTIYQKTIANLLVSEDAVQQFQIPFSAADFTPAKKICYRWYVVSPNGAYISDIGFYYEK